MTGWSQGIVASGTLIPGILASGGGGVEGKWWGSVATNPFQFIQEVRQEASKVVWPTRRETMITTVMVFIMCTFAAIFFFLVDRVLGWGIGLILG